MLRLVILINIIYYTIGCELSDNSINGSFGSVPSAPVGLMLNLNNCSNTPPEALPYSCSLLPETLYTQKRDSTRSDKLNFDLNSIPVVSFDVTQNSCTGLSVNSEGLLEGELAKTVAETCSLSIRGSMDGFTVEETLNITVAPSLSFSFTNENIFIKEGLGEVSVDLVLSEPAPYDTYVEFEMYGDPTQVLSGLSFITKKINILKGQNSVTLNLFVPPTIGISQVVYQQLRLISGSVNPLPGVSINSYDDSVTPHSFEQIAAGDKHTCGIDDGKLFCWGHNSFGQLGNGVASGGGASTQVETPQQIGTSTLWQKVALGTYHTCGIDGGKLFCWGYDIYGQVGNDSSSSAAVEAPQQIGSSTLWQNIALGYYHTCGIDNGNLFCWGRDSDGQVGNDSSSSAKVEAPQQIGSSNLWQKLALGDSHTCGINNGNLFCWGYDYSGQVGNGNGSNADVEAPLQIGSSNTWQSLAAGYTHTCGIDDDKLFCWGNDRYGQLGNGIDSGPSVYAPQQIGSSSLWRNIALGEYYTCGIEEDKLYCWGRDDWGQLGNGSGNGSGTDVEAPQQIGSSNMWQNIALGVEHTCGTDDGKLFCWGKDDYGQVGNGSGSSATFDSPQQIGSSNAWQNVGSGGNHSCGIDSGKLFCWGSDLSGGLGNGSDSNTNVENPQQIGSSNTWQSAALGSSHSCGINSGKLFCWGYDYYGQVGNGSGSSANVDSPLQIGSSSTWQSVALASRHTCGIDDGKLYCWGGDPEGQVGNGIDSGANIDTPQQIGSSNTWQSVNIGFTHSCGIDNGMLFCWGKDNFGQIGNGSVITANVDSPQQIGSSNTWQSVAAGSSHSCGIDDGKLFCWGKDEYGRLGNGSGSTADIDTPQQIGSSNTWQSIAAGSTHSCGIDDGNLFCWGADYYRQIGNGSSSTLTYDTPQLIGSSNTWQSLTLGTYFSCGIAGGKLFCWGSNSSGQVGQSTSFLGSPFLILE